MNKLFTLEDIKPQLNEKQIKEVEHIIYIAKEVKHVEGMQMFQLGDFGRKIIVLASGKMMFFPDKEEVCKHCGAKIIKEKRK